MSRVYYELHTTYKTEEQAQRVADKEAQAFTEYGDTVLETWVEPKKYETSGYDVDKFGREKRVAFTVTGYNAVILYVPSEN